MGRGTYIDIPWHLSAAIRIVKLRFMNNTSNALHRPFDRLAVESVMYQIFLVSTGCWAGENVHGHFEFDPHFWLQCEGLLARSTMFPDRSASCNSPVLGVPSALFKLILTIKQLLGSHLQYDKETVQHLKSEVAYWEAAMTLGDDRLKEQRTICDDATFLYILIASLLVEQLDITVDCYPEGLPQPVQRRSWQLEEMAEILRRRHKDSNWERCFVANWPVYTAGFFVTDEADIDVIREDLSGRWARSNFAQVARYKEDLEKTWAQRHLPHYMLADFLEIG